MKKMTTFVISKDVVKPTEEIIELIGQFRSEIPTLESEEMHACKFPITGRIHNFLEELESIPNHLIQKLRKKKIFCAQCGTKNIEENNYCKKCGEEIRKI